MQVSEGEGEGEEDESSSSTMEDPPSDPDMKDLFRLIASKAHEQKGRDRRRDKELDKSIGALQNDVAEFHVKVETQLATHSRKLEELSVAQASLVHTDENLQQQIEAQGKRVTELENQMKEVHAHPTASVRSAQIPLTGAQQHPKFVPESIVFDKYTTFGEKESQGADYPEVEQLRLNWKKKLESGPSKHLVEYLDMAVPDMNFAGTALSFSMWFPEQARLRLPELVAAFQRVAHEDDMTMKGKKIARVQVQKPPQLKVRQEKAGIVLCGLETLLGSRTGDDPKWVPNVFFGGTFSVLVGHLTPNQVPDSFGRLRPSVGQRLLGNIDDNGVVQWRDSVVKDLFQVDGAEIEALGIENRKR